ncbi:MAG TPA: alpha/beta fold hydrolase [Planctomycetes bacterium]|nr:alpha/beta fold hydrolase [Fuerstiella sp.]HIK94484.1 alpha/beta fold hydrolase [Planctomycetota bacterium]
MTQNNRFSPSTFSAALAGCCLVLFAGSVSAADETPRAAIVVDRTFIADHDGTEQKYVVMRPQEFSPDQPVSILIALHGHGSDRWQFVRQTRGECRATRDVAVANGMWLVSPDYRAKTSWMGPAAEADVLQIIRTLKQQFNVSRVIICGGSMGGTGALTFSALHPDVIDGVVSLNGTANLVDYDRFQDAIAASYGGSKAQVPEEYRNRSAEFFPEKVSMPLAATTGGQDNVVPPESVLRLIDNIRKHNSNVLSIHRPTGGHSTNYADTKKALEFVIAACGVNP